ncbi:MAG: hypothetical protein GX803_06525 [Lentisphaerae bacterium]|jgi:hypothetical protein|nr:hypothetical protein [Lentisphaerota bacterium]
MKKLWIGGVMLAALLAPAWGQPVRQADKTAPGALLQMTDAPRWQVGLAYANLSRSVDVEGFEVKLKGDVADVYLAVQPTDWLRLYGQAGASRARLDSLAEPRPGAGAGGLLGAGVNVWQFHPRLPDAAWRFTVGLLGQVGYRTTDDKGGGEIRWLETLVALPVDYHLTFARNTRNRDAGDFHSVRVYGGPALSTLDGTWKRGGTKRDIKQAEKWGAVGGAELWLLDNLAFGARADWFDHTTLQLTVRYCF